MSPNTVPFASAAPAKRRLGRLCRKVTSAVSRRLALVRLARPGGAVRRTREVVVETGAVRLDEEHVVVAAVVIQTEVPASI